MTSMTLSRKRRAERALAERAPDHKDAVSSEMALWRRATAATGSMIANMARFFSETILPPLLTLALVLFVWQILCSRPGATLPAPTVVWAEAGELVLQPFFDNGPQDIGLGWRVLVSIERVMIGFGLAAIVGILLGTLVGQSIFAMRGLDPLFQILRTVPPLAWLPLALAAFRDSNPSAIFVIFITSIWPIIINTAAGIRNIPQDYRNVALVLRLDPFEFFFKIMVPAAAPYIFTGLRIGIGLAWLAIVVVGRASTGTAGSWKSNTVNRS